jgi:hypothetical protein
MTPPSLSISESAATQFFVTDFWYCSGIVDCRFLNRQWCRFAADFWIGSDAVFIVGFLIGNDGVKPNVVTVGIRAHNDMVKNIQNRMEKKIPLIWL